MIKKIKLALAKILNKPVTWLYTEIQEELHPKYEYFIDKFTEKMLKDKDFLKWANKYLKYVK